MKKLLLIFTAALFCLSVIFSSLVPAQEEVMKDTKHVTKKAYHKTKHGTKKAWHKTKHGTKKAWHKGHHWGHKTVKKTKMVVNDVKN